MDCAHLENMPTNWSPKQYTIFVDDALISMEPYSEQFKKNKCWFYIYLASAYYFLDTMQILRMQNWIKYNLSLKEI